MIKQSTIERLNDLARIEEVIGWFVELRRRGANYNARCPFHDERTPSFTVSPAKGIYKCFGCGRAGNAIKFVMEHESFGFEDAVRFLAGKYNIEVEVVGQTEEELAVRDEKERLFLINDFARKHYESRLFEHDEGRSLGLSYFHERGFRDDIIKKFQLGFAIKQGDDLTQTAEKRGFAWEDLNQLGLSKEREGRRFDFYRGRVMFALHNLSGKVIGFAGRVLGSTDKGPKYINSPDTPLYDKRKVLYGLAFARSAIQKNDQALIVEGYTDVLSLFQAGIENTVAVSGTALTEEHIRLLRRFTSNITLVFDGDAAGLKAAQRSIELVLKQDLNVRILQLPAGEDPDSYVRSVGQTGFTDYVTKEAKDFVLHMASSLHQHEHDPIKRAEGIKEIVRVIALVSSPIKRELYIRECSSVLEMREEVLLQETNRALRKHLAEEARFKQRAPVEAPDPGPLPPDAMDLPDGEHPPEEGERFRKPGEIQEYDMVRVLLEYGSMKTDEGHLVAELILAEIADIELLDSTCNAIVKTYREHLVQHKEAPPNATFINHQDPHVAETAIDMLTERYEISANWREHGIHVPDPKASFKQDANSAVGRWKLHRVVAMMERNLQDLKEAKTEEEQEKFVNVRLKLMEWQQQLSKAAGTVIIK